MKQLFYISILLVLLTSCKHKTNFNDLPEVSYSKTIEPIIAGNCTQNGCHGSGEHESFELLSYNDVMRHCKIVPGDPEQGRLYSVVNTYNKNNIMPPPPSNKLTEQQIQYIYVWIGQGAKNN
jgi:hypothetical protein